jgi:recombination protein RecR
LNLPSKLLEDAVQSFAQLPGIGQKSALRMVLHLLRMQPDQVDHFGETLLRLRKELRYCTNCHNVCSDELCTICSDGKRISGLVCVVEDIRDVIAIENTAQFKGQYHVLGGLISPMDGVGPSQLHIDSLVDKVAKGNTEEVVVALSTTMEGDTTLFYLYKKLKPFNIRISTLARGVSIGGELEYADEVTLGRSIVNRVLYENELVKGS